jgi:long-chain acyl-CoA synthetase
VNIVGNICVYASISESKPIAIIVPVEAALKQLAKSISATGDSVGNLAHNDGVRVEVLKQMQTVGKRAGLANIEIIEGVVLSEEDWTPENVSIRL